MTDKVWAFIGPDLTLIAPAGRGAVSPGENLPVQCAGPAAQVQLRGSDHVVASVGVTRGGGADGMPDRGGI